jgi:hypothetical protein
MTVIMRPRPQLRPRLRPRLVAEVSLTKRGPVRMVSGGGMKIAAPRADQTIAKVLATAAARLVRYFGLVTVHGVMERARALTGAPITETAARAVLAALPRTRWLDDHREWFSFADPRGRMEAALDKIFSLVHKISLDELRAALAKAAPGVRDAPVEVVRRHAVGLGRCRAKGPFLERPAAAGGSRPTRREAVVVGLLDEAGGELDIETLRRRARAASLPRTTLKQLIAVSPLFLTAARGRVRLVGEAAAAARILSA